MGTPPQQGPVPTLPQQLPVNPGSLDDNTVNLFRQMMQAQDEQIRAQAAQVQQLTQPPKDKARTAAEPEARECSRHDKEKQACDVNSSTAACGSGMLSRPSEWRLLEDRNKGSRTENQTLMVQSLISSFDVRL